ncbi:MAG: sigma-54 dependent transcriptional regulator [Myxococcales bacterium]|nr:sigma-54 dependent transcriptional regulator [Myxococcales bacterium]
MDTQQEIEHAQIALITMDTDLRDEISSVAIKLGVGLHVSASVGAFLDTTTPFICVCVGIDEISTSDRYALMSRIQRTDLERPVLALYQKENDVEHEESWQGCVYETLPKPIAESRLVAAIRRAMDRNQLARSLRELGEELKKQKCADELVSVSGSMQEALRQIERVLTSDIAVALLGESGVGKDILARMIHERGHRSCGPFVVINCAAMPEALHEAELFGHEHGAFRGAPGVHPGRLEQAQGGTLYLDEVGELSSLSQANLLRALRERTVRRIGGNEDIPIDVRILCSSRRNLQEDIKQGRFREDLYFRLVVYPINIPPLRERLTDLLPLIEQILVKRRPSVGRKVERVSPEALRALNLYDWPGNIRELEGIIHSAMLSAENDAIEVCDLPSDIQLLATYKPSTVTEETNQQVVPIRELERRAIQHALRATGGSVEKAAKLLGMGRATLYRRLAKYDTLQEPSPSMSP